MCRIQLDAQGAPQFSEHDMHSGPELFYIANHGGRFTRIWSRFGHQDPSAVPISEYGKSVRCRGQAHGILAEIYHKKKNTAAELEQWQLAANAPGAEVGVRGRAFREAGVIHLKQGDTAKAEAPFRQAVLLAPSGYAWRTESLIALSSLLIQNQRAREAVKVFEDTDFTKIENITSKGNLPEARARALLAAGKKIKAIETFDQLLQLDLPAAWKERINTELDQLAEEL